ncbi:MAG: formyltransferase family protein [Thermodesulfobacteriota bacterium]|nr:formyltransferase family protein [Thermodesulfobacteriota bacterium]
MVLKIGWFSTGRGEGSINLLKTIYHAISTGDLKAEICFLFCNREKGEAEGSDRFLSLAQSYQLPIVTFSSKRFKPEMRAHGKKDPDIMKMWRREFDLQIIERIRDFSVDISVLAGYLLVMGEMMCESYDIINLHPAPPGGPKGTWKDVIWELIEKRAESAGAMMHLVTKDLDEGPPITYCSFPIRGGIFEPLWEDLNDKIEKKGLSTIMKDEGTENPLFKKIRQEEVIRELPLVTLTLIAFAEGNIKITDKKLFDAFGNEITGGYCLSNRLEKEYIS